MAGKDGPKATSLTDAVKQLQWELHGIARPMVEGATLRCAELEFSTGIDRVDGPLSSLRFLREYVARNKPVILGHCVDDWPCMRVWTSQYLSRRIGEKDVPVATTPDGRADAIVAMEDVANPGRVFECFAEPHEETMSFDQFAVRLKDRQSSTVSYMQHQNDNLRTLFPELCTDVDVQGPTWAREAFGHEPEAVNLWIGDDRSVTSFHKDHYENIYLVVEGIKEFTLLPPCAANRLYFKPYPHGIYRPDSSGKLLPCLLEGGGCVEWSPVDLDPALRHKWPLFDAADYPPPLRCRIQKGEILYLPSLWYHHVTQKRGGGDWVIAVNYWYDMAFDTKFAHHAFVQALTSVMM